MQTPSIFPLRESRNYIRRRNQFCIMAVPAVKITSRKKHRTGNFPRIIQEGHFLKSGNMHSPSPLFGLYIIFLFTLRAEPLEYGSVTKYRVAGHIRNLFIRVGKVIKRNIDYLSAIKTDDMIVKVGF